MKQFYVARRNFEKIFQMIAIDCIIDSTTPLSKNLLAVIRKFLHKDLTTKLTCVKQIKDKLTLKPSLFYDCIIG